MVDLGVLLVSICCLACMIRQRPLVLFSFPDLRLDDWRLLKLSNNRLLFNSMISAEHVSDVAVNDAPLVRRRLPVSPCSSVVVVLSLPRLTLTLQSCRHKFLANDQPEISREARKVLARPWGKQLRVMCEASPVTTMPVLECFQLSLVCLSQPLVLLSSSSLLCPIYGNQKLLFWFLNWLLTFRTL